ncbi:MAG: hypothetical protein SFV15_26275 [Polyangiaceae bacterium]|nr:hypothetical protein [Polyangiaceae bacterium]
MTLFRAFVSVLPSLALVACGAEFHAADGSADGSGGSAMANLVAPGVLPTVPPGGAPLTGAGSGISGTGGATSTEGPGNATGGAKSAAGGGGNASGGAGREACAEGKVTLRLMPPVAAPAGTYCQSSCSVGWLEITTSEGVSIVTSLPCGAVTCDQCQKMACSASTCVNTSLPAKGVAFEWDGSQFLANTCSNNVCQEKSCVARGRFFAKMCMPLTETQNGAECVAAERVVCTDPIGFDFPGPSVVSGTLPLP